MTRQSLLEQLQRYVAADANEEKMRKRLLSFVADEERCFERSLATGHITGSAFVVDRERTHTLLHHHRRLDKWLQLGGHADGEADVLNVALREAREESGLEEFRPVTPAIFDVDIHGIPARGAEPEHLHYDVRYLLEADRTQALGISPESKALAWVPLSGVAGLTSEKSMLRMVHKALKMSGTGHRDLR